MTSIDFNYARTTGRCRTYKVSINLFARGTNRYDFTATISSAGRIKAQRPPGPAYLASDAIAAQHIAMHQVMTGIDELIDMEE